MKPHHRIPALITLLFCTAFGLLHAEDQTATYRIIGLFAPEMEVDLRKAMGALPEVQLVSLDFDKAEVTLHYDVEQIIPLPTVGKKRPDRSAEKVTQKLEDLLRKASKGTFVLTAPSTLPVDQLTKLDFKLGILDCKGCRYTAYIAVAKLLGVERAMVNAGNGTLTAWIDPAKTDRDALEAALKKTNALAVP